MNRATKMFTSAKERANNMTAKAAVVGSALVPGLAFAGGGSGFDSSAITTAISDNAAIAVGIIGAFALAVWSLKAMGLLKRG